MLYVFLERKNDMAACEKCWGDAYYRHITTGKSQSYCYHKLLEERKNNPCSPREQAGHWWDTERQCDKRHITNRSTGPKP